MKFSIPNSLIQIHYHNRPCGVTKVMENYACTFKKISKEVYSHNIILCHDTQSGMFCRNTAETISVKDCDYRKFLTKNSILSVRDKILLLMKRIVFSPDIKPPVCIIAHNLSLGKNIALSIAFTELLRNRKTSNKHIRVCSVVHDMPEEGRTELMRMLRHIESLGIPVWKYLYPCIKGLQYVVLNRRNYNLFKKADFPVFFLPNPLEIKEVKRLSLREHSKIASTLNELSKKDKISINISKKTIFYPVRVISRKNVIEAIIIACLLHDANLIVGACGTSKHDKKLFDRIEEISRKYSLPVILDIKRLQDYLPECLLAKAKLFELLYRFSDLCISTSIAEGFGYSLYEPWLYNKKVIGRLPLGVSFSEDIELTHLYTHFNIPVTWLSLARLKRKYYFQMKKTFGTDCFLPSEMDFDKKFSKSFIYNGTIDFGVLDQKSQFDIIEKLCLSRNGSSDYLNVLKNLNRIKVFPQVSKNMDMTFIKNNREGIKDSLSGRPFENQFKKCFCNSLSLKKTEHYESKSFLHFFSCLDKFRLLMNSVS